MWFDKLISFEHLEFSESLRKNNFLLKPILEQHYPKEIKGKEQM